MKHLSGLNARVFAGLGLGVAVSLLTTGCTTLQAQSRVDPQTIAVYPPSRQTTESDLRCPDRLHDDSHGGAINLDCFKFPEDVSGGSAYTKAVSQLDSRERLANILIKHSDDICTLEMGRLTANEATVNTALSVLTTGFSTTASIVSGDTAQRILSGLATASNASRSHINAEIYRNALSPVVARAIQNKRTELKRTIARSLLSKDYSVDHMILDVNEYHQACSFYFGLGLVVKAVDRPSFDLSDRVRSVSLSLAETNIKLEDIRRRIADNKTPNDEKDALRTQRDTLIVQQTNLLTERASLTSNPAPTTGNQ